MNPRRHMLLGTLLLTACHGFGAEPQDSESPSRVDADGRVVLTRAEALAAGVVARVVRAGVVSEARTRFGRVVALPNKDVRIVAPVQGRLLRVQARSGQRVERGTAIAVLAPELGAVADADLELRLADIQARAVAIKQRLLAAKVELARIESLEKTGLATRSQKAAANAELRAEYALAGGLTRSERILHRHMGDRIEVKAPSAGILAQLDVKTGTLLGRGQLIARLITPSPVRIRLSVPPDEPTADGYRVQTQQGEVIARLGARGSTASRGVRQDWLEVRPTEHGATFAALLPGRMVAVKVRYRRRGVLVPLGAMLRRTHDTTAFVEVRPGVYDMRHLQIGGDDGQLAAVTSGIAAGERVVEQGAVLLLGELGFSGRSGEFKSASVSH